MNPARAQSGSAPLALVVGCASLSLLLAGLGALSGVVGRTSRAAVVAELAALAAADTVRGLRAGSLPCVSARDIATANGAHLESCETAASEATVRVRVGTGPVAASAAARAGEPGRAEQFASNFIVYAHFVAEHVSDASTEVVRR